jgi:SecD/SecF fusion protein
MTTDEFVIAQVAEANPVPDSATPTAQQRAEADRILRHVFDDAPAPRRPRLRLGLLAPVVSAVVVILVAAVLLRTGGTSTPATGGSGGGLTITLRAQPTPQTPRLTSAAMSRQIALTRRRLASLGHGFTVSQSGADGIVVTAPSVRGVEPSRVANLITQPGRLSFYDWEADVLTPSGKPAAGGLLTQDPRSITLSTGRTGQAGGPGGGGVPLYQAVTLAAKQPTRPGGSRSGPAYYLFGAPGSAACAAVARDDGALPVQGQHCLLSGPDTSLTDLASGLPQGVSRSQGELVTVRQGTVVLQAASQKIGPDSPNAQFYVLRDDVALTGKDITDPRASTDQSGNPDVTFSFNGKGQSAFQRVTATIAHRGTKVSQGGASFNQHFAVALGNQLVTVPQISYRQYPEGIVGDGGADITDGFTVRSARDLATELRYGPLPLNVRVVP